METVFADITDYLLNQSWQIAIIFAVVAIICMAIRKKTAHLRYLLWLLIIAKCLVPSVITVSLAILPQRPQPESVYVPPEPASAITLEPVIEAPDLPVRPIIVPPKPTILERLAQIPPKTWFSGVWLGGVSLYLLIVLIKAARFNRRLKGQRKRLTAGMQKEIDELLGRFGVHAKLHIWLLDGIGQPFVWGLLRGSIFLPAKFGQIGSREHRRGILMHEITHVVRFDAAVNCLQAIAQAIFWFHPLVWLANRNIRAEREKCCDETAIARLSAAPKVYSSAIVDTLIAEYQSTLPVPSLAIAGPIKNIEDRIKTIMKPGKKFYNRPTIIAIATILLLAIAAVPTTIALTHRQPKKPEEFLAKTDVQVEDGSVRQSRHEAAVAQIEKLGGQVEVKTSETGEDYTEVFLSGSRRNEEYMKGGEILHLYVDRWEGGDEGIKHLKGLANLKKLRINDVENFSDEGMAQLKDIKSLESLILVRTQITDDGLIYLKNLTNLESLGLLSNSQITDKALDHLRSLTNLKKLRLDDTQVTDEGLQKLKQHGLLTGLELLALGRTQITDAGLAYLRGMSELKVLYMESTDVTDSGLAHLAGLTKLEVLILDSTQVTGTGLEHLKGLTNLDQLVLGGTKITDVSLFNLKGFTKLQSLFLENPNVTDAGLDHLSGLTSLNQLYLTGSEVSNDGYMKLKRALPNCRIYWEEPRTKPDVQVEDKPVPEARTNLSDRQTTSIASDYKANLPNGVTVELLGICEHPSDGKHWWRPDGIKLAERPYTNMKNRVHPGSGEKAYELAVLLKGTDLSEVGYRYRIESSSSSASGTIESKKNKQLKSTVIGLPEDIQKADVNIGISAGKWETAAQTEKHEGMYAESGNEGGFVWTPPTEDKQGNTIIVVSHSYKAKQVRIIGVDKKGEFYTGKCSGAWTSETVTTRAEIPVELSNLEKFELQIRNFEWVTFKNISLKPKFKPDVQVEILADKPPVVLDLDSGKTLTLEKDWPDEYDVGWDNDGGGVLFCNRAGTTKMLPISEAKDFDDAVSIAFSLQESLNVHGIRGVLAEDSKYIAVKTSQGNIAVLEIIEYSRSKAKVKWKIIEHVNQKPDVQVEVGRARPNSSLESKVNEPADKYNQILEPLNRQRQELEKELEALRDAYADTEHLTGVRLMVSNAELEAVGWLRKRYVASGVVRCEMPNQLLMQAETTIWPDSFEVHTARTAAYLKDRDFLQEVIRRDKVRRTKWFQARKKDMEKAIDSLADSLTVQVKDTADIEVKFTAADPGDAQTILDELLQLFILRKTDQAQNELTKKMADLHEKKNRLKRSIQFMEDEKQTLQKEAQETQKPDVQVEAF